MKHLEPAAPFRKAFIYNNHNYSILQLVIETLAGPFITFVKHNLLDPLGMSSTYFNLYEAKASGRCTEAFWPVAGSKPAACLHWYNESNDGTYCAASMGLVMSSVDMVSGWNWRFGGLLYMLMTKKGKWMQELLCPQIIPKYLIDKCSKPIITTGHQFKFPECKDQAYGMAQVSQTYQCQPMVYHQGAHPGQYSSKYRMPESDLVISLMINCADEDFKFSQTVVFRVLDQILGLETIDWEGRLLASSYNTPDVPKYPLLLPQPQEILNSKIATYHNSGYGSLQLQYVKPNNLTHMSILQCTPIPQHDFSHLLIVESCDHYLFTHILFVPLGPILFLWTAYFVTSTLHPVYCTSGQATITEKCLTMDKKWVPYYVPKEICILGEGCTSIPYMEVHYQRVDI